MNLSDYIDLLPDVYDKGSAPKSNIRKLFEVTADALQILIDTATENKLIKDLFHASGAVLDAIGEDYGLPRYGKNDDDYRALILAKIFARISGNSDAKIINFFRFFTTLPINVVRLAEDSIRIPVLHGLYVWRAFSVEIPGLSTTLRDRLLPALQILKPAGVYGTINFSQIFNPATDLPGTGYSPITTAGESWQSAQNDDFDVLLTVGKIAPGDDAQVMRSTLTTDYNVVGNFPGSTTLRDEIFRFPGEVVYNGGDVLLRVTTTALSRILPDSLASSPTFLHYETGLIFGVGLYAGTPSQNSRVFRSTDGGVTWSRVILVNNNINPATAQYIKAGTAFIITLWTTANRLVFMRSTNNGATWTETVVLTGTTLVVTQLAKSADNNTILAVAADATNTRLYRSTNNGVSWTSQTFAALGIPNTASPRVYYLGGSSFVIVSANNAYRSNDNGVSWALEPIPSGLANTIVPGAGALWLYDGHVLYRYTNADSAPVPYYTERNAATNTIDDPLFVKIPTWGQYPEIYDDGTGRLWITSATPAPSSSNKAIAVCILTSPQFPDKMATYYITKPLANRLMTVISDRIVGLYGSGPATGLFGNLIVSSPLSNNRVGFARYNRPTQALTKITLPAIAFSRCVRFAGILVMASVRYDGLVLYSTDEGSTWRECKFTGTYRPTRVHTLVEFQGKLVAVCHEYRAADTNYTRTYIFDSNDGQNFVYRTAAIGTPGIQDGRRRYRTAVDEQYLYLSNGLKYDGSALVAHNHPIPCLGLSVQGGVMYALSGDTLTNELKLYASTDHGSTYTLISTAAVGVHAVLGMNQTGVTIALGPDGVVSYDKTNWLASNLPNQTWEDVAASIGAFVVVSETEVTNNLQISRMVLP